MLDALKTFRLLEDFENRKARFYEWAADQLAADESLCALFSRLAMDQASRRNALQYKCRMVMKNTRQFQNCSLDASLLARTMEGLDEWLASPPPVPADRLLAFASGLEQQTEAIDYVRLSREMIDQEDPFMTSLHTGCQRHRRLIAERYSAPDAAVAPPLRPEPSPLPLPPPPPAIRGASPQRDAQLELLLARGNFPWSVNKELLIHLLEALTDGVYIVDDQRRILYWNRAAERIAGYSPAEMEGKHCFEDALVHMNDRGCVQCDKECPLRIAMSGGSTLESHLTLHHRDGHRIPITVTVHPLKDAKDRIIGAVEIFRDERTDGGDKLAELERLAYIDPLTSLANRRFLEVTLLSRLNELQRFGWPFGLLFVDIDNFKKINDTYGHEKGDLVLQMVGRTLQANSRLFDLAGRWGGEEFLLVLANVHPPQIEALAEKFRILVAGSNCKVGGDRLGVTVSIGATPAMPEDTLDGLVNRADQLMYRSKREGRNLVSALVPDQTLNLNSMISPSRTE